MFAEEICLQECVNLTSQPNSNSQDECFYQNFFSVGLLYKSFDLSTLKYISGWKKYFLTFEKF